MSFNVKKITNESTPLLAQSREPGYLNTVAKAQFLSAQTLTNRSDIRTPGVLKEPRRLMGADGPLQPVVDASSAVRNGAAFAGGMEFISYDPSMDISQPLMGLTLATFTVSAVAQTVENVKRMNFAQKIGDTEGQKLAAASLVITVPLAGAGMTALAEKTLRVYDMAQTLQNVNYQPVAEVSQSITVLGTATLVLFGLYNAALVFISSFNLYRKWKTKNEVESLKPTNVENQYEDDDSVRNWLGDKLDVSSELNKCSEEDLIKLALNEGDAWLTKLEKDWKKLGLAPLNGTKSRNELIKDLFLIHEDEMALHTGVTHFEKGKLLLAFGKKVKTQELQAAAQQKLIRVLGKDIIDKFYTTTAEITKTEVIKEIDKGMNKSRWLIFLGILGVALCISAIVFTGGLAGLFVALAFVLSAILWVVGWDGNRLINQWSGQETGKLDKAMLIFSSLLNIIAVVGTIVGMVIFTGGIALVPLLLLIGVGLFWAIINIRGVYTYHRHTYRPWEFEKVVSFQSFHKLVMQETNAVEIDKYFKKMHLSDQALFRGDKNWQKTTPQILTELAQHRVHQLEELNNSLRHLSRS
ncbi:MAG: hypothetical protein JSR58_07680 [Verrucomicrobia bacterium]|nr:hypothetical protein [Verrucomicrobiota bacterium]